MLVVVICGSPCQAQAPVYLQEDATLSGDRIISFADASQQVSLIKGSFSFTAGKNKITAQEAVVWIAAASGDNGVRRDIVIYAKGNARIVQEGATTTDKSVLVVLHQQGGLTAKGKMEKADASEDPLYVEALGVRRESRQAATGVAATQSTQAATATAPATSPRAPAATSPSTALGTPDGPAATTAPATAPAKREPQAVSFTAQSIKMEELAKGKQVVILRGKIYISQGGSASGEFLELRGQFAVVYLEELDEKKADSPYAPRVIGMPAGESGKGVGIAGVYIEDDVIISRGERTMRADSAFYDFTKDRAIVINPVFRTVQEQRNIPITVRAKEARLLSAKESYFKDAKVSTSDFHTPEYYIGASSVYMRDESQYDEEGVRITPQKFYGQTRNPTFVANQVPLLWLPYTQGDMTDGHSALRKAAAGSARDMGFGVQTEWELFRLLGLLKPEGFSGRLDFEVYERGVLAGVDVDYARRSHGRQYSGYTRFYGLLDNEQEDDFGDDRENIESPAQRGRWLTRHKELFGDGLELWAELSYICDRNFLEKFFPDEFYTGKEQETLVYIKKQKDNWAVTSLLQTRLNRFDTQTESFPDLSFYLIGQPLLDGNLLYFNESHLGAKRFRPANFTKQDDSDIFARADSRNELFAPLWLGQVRIAPYAVGRGTYWGDSPDGSSQSRPYGQVGVKTSTNIWRVYNDVQSRLWDINKLKHVITPEAVGFLSADGGVTPDDLFPISPDIEQRLGRINGGSFGVYQRLVTKRGPAGQEHDVDWMRLNVVAGFYDTDLDVPPANGRFMLFRPENSTPRDHVNSEYEWNISDATAFLSDVNYDVESSDIARANAGFAITRDPRLRYYFGTRYIRDLDSSVGTFGFNYRINRKYTLSVFEQYDFDYDSGVNLGTSVSIIRKLPRWYAAFTVVSDQRTDDLGVFLTFWPEGVPEVKFGDRMGLLPSSSNN